MKLSRIEPFSATPVSEEETERVKKELNIKQKEAPPAVEQSQDFAVFDSTAEDPSEAMLRFSDFLKKKRQELDDSTESVKKGASERKIVALARYQYQNEWQDTRVLSGFRD